MKKVVFTIALLALLTAVAFASSGEVNKKHHADGSYTRIKHVHHK